MKIDTRTNTVQSNLSGEKIALGLSTDADDLTHILSILTDLYKDRLLAIIREYSSNAFDAHVEAGVSLPIEITLPTALAPFLKVRDYGTGLDVEDVRTIYSQYGRSTKRQTNDQVGMLGVGCKSALTYTSQFTVTSVKDGRRITVLIARDENGGGSMQVLGDELTSDANGTEVTVNVRREDHGRAATLAEQFFSYWTQGTVLVNGKQPASFMDNALKVTDSLYICEGAGEADDRVVMGNVAYPQPISLPGLPRDRWNTARFSLVAIVPIGSVKPTPSRESLMDTAQTKATLSAVAESFDANISGAIQREVNNCASHTDALRTVVKWSKYVPNAKKDVTTYRFKNTQLPLSWTPANGEGIFVTRFDSGNRSLSAGNNMRSLGAEVWPQTVWVEDYAPANFVANHKHKLRKWCADNGIGGDGTVEHFALVSGKAPRNPFIDQSRIVSWDEVRAIKLNPANTSGTRTARLSGSFDIHTEKGVQHEVPGSDLRLNETIIWKNCNAWQGRQWADILRQLCPSKPFTLVCLPANRVNKFCREVPAATTTSTVMSAWFKEWRKRQNRDDLLAFIVQDQYRRSYGSVSYSKLDAAKVNDPKLKQAIRLCSRDIRAKLGHFRDIESHMGKETFRAGLSWVDPIRDYPLLEDASCVTDDLYFYLNAKHAKMLDSATA